MLIMIHMGVIDEDVLESGWHILYTMGVVCEVDHSRVNCTLYKCRNFNWNLLKDIDKIILKEQEVKMPIVWPKERWAERTLLS